MVWMEWVLGRAGKGHEGGAQDCGCLVSGDISTFKKVTLKSPCPCSHLLHPLCPPSCLEEICSDTTTKKPSTLLRMSIVEATFQLYFPALLFCFASDTGSHNVKECHSLIAQAGLKLNVELVCLIFLLPPHRY